MEDPACYGFAGGLSRQVNAALKEYQERTGTAVSNGNWRAGNTLTLSTRIQSRSGPSPQLTPEERKATKEARRLRWLNSLTLEERAAYHRRKNQAQKRKAAAVAAPKQLSE
jgi:hypothetical protein